jgi:curved DNA-binding protein CbpA
MSAEDRWQQGSQTHYDVLNVPFDAKIEQIREAYRALALELHPDRNPAADAARAMQLVNDAWHVLGDVDRKWAYDQNLFGPPVATRDDDYYGRNFNSHDPRLFLSNHRFRVPFTMILLVVLVFIFFLTAYVGPTSR